MFLEWQLSDDSGQFCSTYVNIYKMQDKKEDVCETFLLLLLWILRVMEKSKCTYQQQTIEDECFCTRVNKSSTEAEPIFYHSITSVRDYHYVYDK